VRVKLKSVRSLLILSSRERKAGRESEIPEFRPILRQIGGGTFDVETRRLHADCFELKTVLDIVPAGFTIPAAAVEEVIGDVRPTAAKCNHCGWSYKNVKDASIGKQCPKCGEGLIERLGPLRPDYSLARTHLGLPRVPNGRTSA